MLDENGVVVPVAENQICFLVDGDTSVTGVDNGNPVSHEPLKGSKIKAFNGKCLAVVQAGESRGEIQFTATSEGLQESSVRIVLE